MCIDGQPQWIGVWRCKNKDPLDRLQSWYKYCNFMIPRLNPDRLLIEIIRVSTSHDTTRSLSRIESIAIVTAQSIESEIIEYSVKIARSAYFGESVGGISKEDAHSRMRALYPHLDWLPATTAGGGFDQSDALIPALAHERIIERKKQILEEKKAKRARKKVSPQ